MTLIEDVSYAELNTLLPKADIVVILVPLTAETHHLVNADFLATMKQGAMLVNAGRLCSQSTVTSFCSNLLRKTYIDRCSKPY